MATEFVPAEAKRESTSTISTLVGQHADRLGINRSDAIRNALSFADVVATLESDKNPMARNKPQKGKEASTASGLYQFVEGSIEPAVNRLEKYIGMEDWMKDAVKHKDATKLSEEQQTLLFLGDLLEKEGSDKYMKGILGTASLQDMQGAYYELHHTNPDEATRKRTTEYIGDIF